jgi:hypothetical protein
VGLDALRVDMESGGSRFAVCVASYGYMGDLMAASEKLRCLGPARYGLAGALAWRLECICTRLLAVTGMPSSWPVTCI